MRKQVKIASIVLMVVLFAAMAAAAVQAPAPQQTQTTSQLVIGAQDVITASDAGGGALASRDLIWIILIGVAVVILILVL